jgi:hypothetical protein
VTWFGILAPGNTPKDVVAKLNAAFNKALQQADLRKKLDDEGAEPAGGTPGAIRRADQGRPRTLGKDRQGIRRPRRMTRRTAP